MGNILQCFACMNLLINSKQHLNENATPAGQSWESLFTDEDIPFSVILAEIAEGNFSEIKNKRKKKQPVSQLSDAQFAA